MKDFKKSYDIAVQSNIDVRKSQKHDANLRKNSSLYFQIGLILCLLGTYAIFEMRFETKNTTFTKVRYDLDDTFTFNSTVVIAAETPQVVPIKKLKRKRRIIDPVIVDDISTITETSTVTADPPVMDKPLSPNAIDNPVEPFDIPEVFNMVGVEVVPVYPGCEKMTTNVERIKCMNTNIAKLVQRKFDTDLAGHLGLTGTQRISVQFKIDQNGHVTEVLSRAPHPSLEKEARRVAHKIPQMKPGLQRKQPVAVLYNLPIVFKVN
jgi:protein TonB